MVKLTEIHTNKENNLMPNLTDFQQKAYDEINGYTGPGLLWGITGSGKTSLIIKKVLETQRRGYQSLILVPEVAIISHFESSLKKYGITPLVWHSQSKNKKKFKAIKEGTATVVLGARSALLLPFNKLGFIAIDEEHSSSYFQENSPSYNGRDMALLRSSTEGCDLWLCSATPSIETLYNVKRGLVQMTRLNIRFNNSLLAPIQFIDPGYHLIAPELLEKCRTVINNGGQILIYCNRRAIAPTVICRECNRRQACKCENYITKHRNYYQCHKCNKRYDLDICVFCKKEGEMDIYGFGVDRIAAYAAKQFSCKIGVFSSDHCYNAKTLNKFLDQVHRGDIQVIVATQMASKGHNFPLSMVIMLNTESLGASFETTAMSMQNLIQVAGRVGRGDIAGTIYVQRRIQLPYESFLKNQDYSQFSEKELISRQDAKLPPYSKLVMIEATTYYTKILNNVVANSSTCHIYEDSYPKILFTCRKKNYPYTLKEITQNIPKYRIKILS